MAGAHRADRLAEEGACYAENLPSSFRARCAEWKSAREPRFAEPDLVPNLVRILDQALRALGDRGEQDAACLVDAGGGTGSGADTAVPAAAGPDQRLG